MRKKIIAGNWKMNKTPAQTAVLIEEIKKGIENPKCDIIVCTPYTNLSNALLASQNSEIKVGAQNMYFEESGAFTGEISADMLKDIGVGYVIIGHSERRQYFGETDITVNKKTLKAIEKDLIPIVCVGETLEQREQGITEDVIRKQTKVALLNVKPADVKELIIAYEPVWAIGTGKTATDSQANEVCSLIRDCISGLYGDEIGCEVRILYGGSMNAKNAAGLLAKSDIDGGLIGGASLKAEDFSAIIKSC